MIVPSFTFCSTVNSLVWNGLEPVFADVDPQTYCPDPEDVKRRITPRTVGIAALHTFGLPADIGSLEDLAPEHGLRLVFDAAHGLGGRYQGSALGAFGDASVFSLSGTKLVTGGEGGLATFRDPADAERFSYLRAYGFKGDYNCRYIGLNGKVSELNAALGWLSLDLIDTVLARRHAQVDRYREALCGCPERGLANCARGLRPRLQGPGHPVSKARAAPAVEASLAAAGIMTKRYFFPAHRMEVYRSDTPCSLPVTDDLYERLLCIPLYHDLADETIDGVAGTIRASLKPHVRPLLGRLTEPTQPAGRTSILGNSGAGLPAVSGAVTCNPACWIGTRASA